MKKFKFTDVSGLGNAGKSAVVDFVKEFSSVEASEFSFEFDLFRLPNGILDLHHHLVEDWSPVRSNEAIRSFSLLTKRLSGSQKKKNLQAFFFSAGTGYEHRFHGKFQEYSQDYVNKFIISHFEAFWPYYLISDYPWIRAYKKILLKLKIQNRLRSPVVLADGIDFSANTTEYVNKIFNTCTDSDKEMIILNNCFEPFNPERPISILHQSKSVLVFRDPRDVYVSGLSADKMSKKDTHLMAFDNNGINKSFLGSDNLDTFITRQKLYFEKLYKGHHPNIKVIRFEEFVLNYEKETNDLMTFLDLKEEDHVLKRKYFDPEKSKKNIGAWKMYSKQDEIRYIEKHLSKYCFQYEP